MSSTALIPDRPAEKGYWNNDWQAQADTSVQNLLSIIQTHHGKWQDYGIADGVHMYGLPRAADEPLSRLPLFMGTTRIEGFTAIEIFTAIRITGYRMMWDQRIQSAHVMRAFSQHEFLFYLVWRGIGPIYNSRDVGGIQVVRCWDQNGVVQDAPDFTSKNIVIAYQSIDDVPGVPQSCNGCTRAKVLMAGYLIEQREGGCDVTYTGSVDLASIIPGFLLSTFSSELPRTPGRLREALKKFGSPPIIVDRQKCIALQFVSLNPDTRVFTLLALITRPATMYIYFDYAKMYTQGVAVASITGSAASSVRVREEIDPSHGLSRRMLALDLLPEGLGGEFKIVLDPRDKPGPDSGTGPGWW